MLLFVVYTVVLSFILLYSLVQFTLMVNYLLFLKVNPPVDVDKIDRVTSQNFNTLFNLK